MLDHPLNQYLGKRLRMRRTMLGLTQSELADEIGVSFQQVQKYENGKNRITVPTLWEIAKTLKVQPDYFWKGFEDS